MGKLYRRGAAYWADYVTPEGERVRKSLRTEDIRVARERLRVAELAATDPAAHREERLLSAAMDHLITVGLHDKSEATRDFYREKCAHLARIFGNVDVTTIDKAQALNYAHRRIHEGAHSHTVGKELIALRRVLLAEHDRFPLPVHPRDVIPKWKMRYVPKERHLSENEFRRLFAKTPEHRRMWLMVAVYTGACLGEIERLEWRHVDLRRGSIALPGTKADERPRTVPIPDPLRPWLAGAGKLRGLIFGVWGNVRRELARYCDNAKVEKVTPNDLRRTFASWMVQRGVANLTVAHLLGHSSTRMVDKVYGRLTFATYQGAVSNLPDCDAGVPDIGAKPGRAGNIEKVSQAQKRANSMKNRVPRDGVEPPTRGFSVRMASKRKASR